MNSNRWITQQTFEIKFAYACRGRNQIDASLSGRRYSIVSSIIKLSFSPALYTYDSS
jgi:hypothetical protein